MKRPRISYAAFDLPFESMPESQSDDESESVSLEAWENQVPADAVFLGTIEDEVNNWTSWKIEDHYYVVPWQGPDFDWALFRISWDDNWATYGWFNDARIAGAPDTDEAARRMIEGVFSRWNIDLRRSENRAYRRILANLRKKRPSSTSA